MKFPSQEEVERVRKEYPTGCRIELISMKDDPQPIPKGTKGTVKGVDDMLGVHTHWDNGSSLAAIYGVDEFKKVGEEKA